MGERLTIVLIDDDVMYARVVQRVLSEEFGRRGDPTTCEMLHAGTLREGLAILKLNSVDAAVLDMSLPDGEGLALFQAVAAAAPALPVVVLTGTDDETLGDAIVQQGAQDYLVKTHIDGYLLRRAILHAIERKKAAEEREGLVRDLREALARIKVLQGILRICSHCMRIRDEAGAWHQFEQYVSDHSSAEFSHSVCPSCLKTHYGSQVSGR